MLVVVMKGDGGLGGVHSNALSFLSHKTRKERTWVHTHRRS